MLDYISSPRNPNRLFLSASICGFVTGHSDNSSDLASMIVDNALKHCQGDLVMFQDVMDWIEESTQVTVRKLDKFLNFPAMFAKSGIYQDLTKVSDEIGPFQIRSIKPWSINFNYSCVNGEWVSLFMH